MFDRIRGRRLAPLPLVATALASEAVYLAAVLGPLSLLAHGGQLADLGTLTGVSSTTATVVTLGLIGLFGLYASSLWAAGRPASPSLPMIIGWTATFSATLIFLYPATATDVYTYVVLGHVLAVDHLNPLLISPASIQNDQFVAYAGSWAGSTSPYGPVWLLLMEPIARVADSRVVVGVLLVKALSAAAVVATTALLGWLGGRAGSSRGRPAAILFGWNPLVQLELVGNGHNDAVMTLLLVAALALLIDHQRDDERRQLRARATGPVVTTRIRVGQWPALPVGEAPPRLAASARLVAVGIAAPILLVASALVKYLTIPALPLCFLALLSDRRSSARRRVGEVSVSALAALAAAVILYAPLWAGPAILQRVGDVDANYLSSIPALIILVDRDAMGWLRYPRLAIVVGVFAWQAWRLGRGQVALATALFDVELTIVLVATHFAGWYLPLLLALAIVSTDPRVRIQALILTFVTTLATPLWAYVWPAAQPGLSLEAFHLIVVPLTFLPSLAVGAWWTTTRRDRITNRSGAGLAGRPEAWGRVQQSDC